MLPCFLISRTDNIGDVVLTLPLVTLIKQKHPEARIIFLARDYVKDIITCCPLIDDFLSWNTLSELPTTEASQLLKNLHITTAIHVFPSKKIARLIKKAGIPHRVGTTRRWFHYFTCNQRIPFSRAKSQLHEAQLNLQLLRALDVPTQLSLTDIAPLIKLTPQKSLSAPLSAAITPSKFNLIIHPCSNGNTREWPIHFFQQLIMALPAQRFNIILTGSAREKIRLQPLTTAINVTNLCGTLSLSELLQLIQACDGLLANSTGPLHLAAALGIKTLGLFPPQTSMSPTRWQPLGKQAQYLVANTHCNKTCSNTTCECIRQISVATVKATIMQWLNPRING